MRVLLSSALFISALFPSLGKDTARYLPLSDQNEGGIVFPTIDVKIEPSEVVASMLLEKNTFNDTKKSIEEEARALAHRYTPHYYPYPKPRYHRKDYDTNYHGGTEGYEAKGFNGKGGGGKGGNGAKGKGKGKGKGYSFSPPRSKYSFSRIGKGKGADSLSSDSNEQGKGKGKGKGDSFSSPPRSKYSFLRISKGTAGSSSSSEEDSNDEQHHDMPASSSCQDIVFKIAQKWGGNDIIEPDGTFVDSVSDASVHSGQRWPFVGPVTDHRLPHSQQHKKNVVGSNTELCTRVNHGKRWHCLGTYQDLYGCQGQLTFSGSFNDDDSLGKYTIVGGTGAFHGAQGHIVDDFDYDTLYSIRQIYIQ